MSPAASAPRWDSLAGEIAGEIVLPDSAAYEAIRKPSIAQFHDIRPRAVARCAAPEDVAAVIHFARRHGLHTATRSGGHCFAGRSSTRGIVVDVTPISTTSLAAGIATVGAGARLGDVYDVLAQHGRTIPAGCGPSVGIAGLALGGGLGILGRRHGLTLDHLAHARVVLADGRIVDCDDQRHEELFWALRGAGAGNFGVVTSLAFRTVPAPATTTYHLVWPHTRAADVVREWQAWAPDGPDELTASLLLTASADPVEPPLVNLFGAMIGSRSDADELLEQLVDRVGTPPAPAEFTHLPYRDAKQHLAERGPGEDRPLGHLLSKSEFVGRALPAEVVQSLVDNLASSRVAGQSRALDFLPWSGAYNRVRPDATAFAHRTARFLLKHTAVVDPDTPTDDLRATRSWLTRSWALVHRWGTGGVYPSFPDADLENWAAAYYGDNYDRLVRVKARYDPTGFFRFHQSLPTRALQPA